MIWLLACTGEEEVRIERDLPEAEQFTVATDDGAAIVLTRRAAEGPPVVIVHGISSNHHCWDLTRERSLAVYLQEQGFDAWLVDLRGHGDATLDADEKRQWAGWSIDHYGQHDIPAAVDFVRQETGYEQVGYVGHSLGGMVGAIYVGTQPGAEDALSSLIAVGSPMDFSDPDPVMWSALYSAGFTWIPLIPSGLGGRFAALFDGKTFTRADVWAQELLFTDIEQGFVPLMYANVASPLTRGELLQLSRVVETQSFVSAEGSIDYTRALNDVTTPTLVIAGRGDQIAPVDRVYAYYDEVGATEKAFVVAGRATGFAADYGHLDLPLGDHAREEIYPLIAEWLAGEGR
ncbi:MAG TPA: alpha/beta hydrolase [Myxococcota bacterium]|nr:alpha/beta hydrolase [Myxococcota bacterium]